MTWLLASVTRLLASKDVRHPWHEDEDFFEVEVPAASRPVQVLYADRDRAAPAVFERAIDGNGNPIDEPPGGGHGYMLDLAEWHGMGYDLEGRSRELEVEYVRWQAEHGLLLRFVSTYLWPLRPRLLDPGPSLRADGQGRVTHLTPPSTLTGEAQLAQRPSYTELVDWFVGPDGVVRPNEEKARQEKEYFRARFAAQKAARRKSIKEKAQQPAEEQARRKAEASGGLAEADISRMVKEAQEAAYRPQRDGEGGNGASVPPIESPSLENNRTEFQRRPNDINRTHQKEDSAANHRINELENQVASLVTIIEGQRMLVVDVDARRFGIFSEAIFIATRSLQPFVVRVLKDVPPATWGASPTAWWTGGVLGILGGREKENLQVDEKNLENSIDLLLCVKIMHRRWGMFKKHCRPQFLNSMESWINRLQHARNGFWAHYREDAVQHHDVRENLYVISKVVGMANEKEEIKVIALIDKLEKIR